MLPSLGLPPLELCFGTNPIQAEKPRPDRNVLGSAMPGDKRGGEGRADTGNLIKASARLAGSVPGPEKARIGQNALARPFQTGTRTASQSQDACASTASPCQGACAS